MTDSSFSYKSFLLGTFNIDITDPLVQLGSTIFLVYTSIWFFFNQWKDNKLRLYIPYWFGIILLLFSGSITGALITDTVSPTNAYLCGTIGGGLVFLITLLSGTNSNLSLVATGSSLFLATLAVNNWNYTDANLQSILIVITVVFSLAYGLTTPFISSYLGYGSRSLILIPIVSYLYPLYGNGLLDSFLNPAYLVPIVPAAICATIIGITRPRSPTYPFSKYIRHLVTTGVSLTVSFIIVIFTSLESTYSVLFTVTTCFALILTILLILSEDSYSNAGPFYSVGRRTTVLQVFAVTYLMFYYENNSLFTNTLNAILLGYAVCTIVTTFSILALNSLGNMSSSTYRAATVDYLSVVGLITGGFLVLLAHPAVVNRRIQPFTEFLSTVYMKSPLAIYVPSVYTTVIPTSYFTNWTSDCYFAMIMIGLFLVSTLTLTSFTSRTLLWSPLYSNVVSRGNPRTRAVSVTFNGISSTITPKILSLLSRYNAKGTFFITGNQAKDNTVIVNTIIEQGHEIGLLSSSESVATEKSIVENSLSTVASPPTSTGSTPRSARSGRSSSLPKKTSTVSSPSVIPSSTSSAISSIHWYRPACGTRNVETLRNAFHQGLGTAYWCSYPIFTTKDTSSNPVFTETVIEQTVIRELGLHRTLDSKDAGTLDPTTVNGAIIAIDNNALVNIDDLNNTISTVFDTVLNAPGKSPSFVTLSELCPNVGDEAEVMRVA